MSAELKMCPFCGSDAEQTGGYAGGVTIRTARCSNRDCIASFKSVDVEVWNRRAFMEIVPSGAAPSAWRRKWDADGEVPEKKKNANGRWAWPFKFKLVPISRHRVLPDDVPLYAGAPQTAPDQAKSAPATIEKEKS